MRQWTCVEISVADKSPEDRDAALARVRVRVDPCGDRRRRRDGPAMKLGAITTVEAKWQPRWPTKKAANLDQSDIRHAR